MLAKILFCSFDKQLKRCELMFIMLQILSCLRYFF